MGKFDEYIDRAKDLAEDAGEAAKIAADEAANRVKEFREERSDVKEFVKSAQEQTAAFSQSAKEKVQGFLQDSRSGKEIKQGMEELNALPEVEGSILYTMELETMLNDLNRVYLIIHDNRMDDESVAGEIRKIMAKVEPFSDPQTEATEEQLAIEKAKTIAYSACQRALQAMQK